MIGRCIHRPTAFEWLKKNTWKAVLSTRPNIAPLSYRSNRQSHVVVMSSDTHGLCIGCSSDLIRI
ncbi:hypothetical protein C8Q80DRAFT_1204453, partial [Daedaleopsis nitida]